MYRFEKSDFFKHAQFAIFDLLCIQLTFLIPYLFDKVTAGQSRSYIFLQVLMTLVSLCVLFLCEPYRKIYARGYWREAKNVLFVQSVIYAATLVVLFLEKRSEIYSRMAMIAMYFSSLVLVYVERIILKKVTLRYFRTAKSRLVLLVTTADRVEETAQNIIKMRESDYWISGIALLDEAGKIGAGDKFNGVPVVALNGGIEDYIRRNPVDEVFLDAPLQSPEAQQLISKCNEMGVTVHCRIEQIGKGYVRNTIEDFGGYTVLTLGANIVSARQLLIKRGIDIVGSVVGLILTGIISLFVAPAIYISSPGPIFFSQERIGLNGRRFRIYKFRSMYMDAEERKAALMAENKMSGFMFKMDDDPRIIKGIGSFIRKTSIDELPQMWNVLKGDMSLVGTRPPTVDEFEQYEYHHKSRLATKPGITGMWQVSGRSDITDFEEVVELDNTYIYNWNLALDIKILLKTVLVVFGKKGSV